jgi:hypothetical protein
MSNRIGKFLPERAPEDQYGANPISKLPAATLETGNYWPRSELSVASDRSVPPVTGLNATCKVTVLFAGIRLMSDGRTQPRFAKSARVRNKKAE